MTQVVWFFLFLCVVKICCSKIPILEIDRYRSGQIQYELKSKDNNSKNKTLNELVTNTTEITEIEEITTSDDYINFIESDYEIENNENIITKNEVVPSRYKYLQDLENILGIKLLNGLRMSIPQKTAPPQFMTDFYQSISKSEDDHKLHGATVIRALLEQDPSNPGIFLFSLNGINDDEEILEAELHVYRIGLENQERNIHSPYYLLRVYQIMPMPRHEYSLNPDVHQLLNVHYISAFSFGWQVFKVKRAVESWRNSTYPNLGFLISATTIFGEPVEVRFARRGLHSDAFQPSLTLYCKKKNDQDQISKIQKRSPNEEKAIASQNSSSVCQKTSMYVNFKELGWDDWIFAPSGFEAHTCSGSCNFHGMDNYSSDLLNNHGLLKNLMKGMIDKNIDICCVPEEYGDLILLYSDMNFDYTLKKYKNMVVKKCACR